MILPHQAVSQQTDVQDASLERNKEMFIGTNTTGGTAQASKAVHLGTRQFGQVDKTLVEATQLAPLSEPSNDHQVRQNYSQKMTY